MHQLTFYLDFISPYAHLAFHALPKALQGLSYQVTYQPILFGAVLQHHGQLGPAEIEGKREWTYRHVQWLGAQQGCALRMPASHPYNPLGMLRLATALNAQGQPNRFQCEQMLHHVWADGLDAADPNSDEVKNQLRQATDAAIQAGVFGVPTIAVDGKLFWGQDALPMLRDYLDRGEWFQGSAWDDSSALPRALARKRT
jgi:2-hydroxychromene-2-carboxylate isomerase